MLQNALNDFRLIQGCCIEQIHVQTALAAAQFQGEIHGQSLGGEREGGKAEGRRRHIREFRFFQIVEQHVKQGRAGGIAFR